MTSSLLGVFWLRLTVASKIQKPLNLHKTLQKHTWLTLILAICTEYCCPHKCSLGLRSGEEGQISGEGFIPQQDNMPKHTLKICKKYWKTNKSSWLSWTSLDCHLTSTAVNIYWGTWRLREPSVVWHHKKLHTNHPYRILRYCEIHVYYSKIQLFTQIIKLMF